MIVEAKAAEIAAVAAGVSAVAVQTQPLLLGIPAGLLLASCAGALFGLAYTRPEDWGRLINIPPGTRMRRFGWIVLRAFGLLFTLVTIAVVSAWAVSVLPFIPLLSWLAKVPQIPLGGLLAFGGQRIIPRSLSAVERWLDRRNV